MCIHIYIHTCIYTSISIYKGLFSADLKGRAWLPRHVTIRKRSGRFRLSAPLIKFLKSQLTTKWAVLNDCRAGV